MTDAFEMLGEPRCPWLSAEALRGRFMEMSAAEHPDRFHGSEDSVRAEAVRRYAALNEAHQTLKEPRTRLLHLIELETGSKPRDIQKIPPGTMDLFVEVGQLCRDVDSFLQQRSQVVSPMLKVRLFTEGMGWVEKLKALQGKVSAREAELDRELRALNDVWASAPSPGSPGRVEALPMVRLEEIYRVMSYANRWTGQIQERLVQLASN
jgi:hypothetical protein